MRKITKPVLLTLVLFLSCVNLTWSQTSPVKITVDWEDISYENKVEVFDPANNLILTICNNNEPNQCYETTGTELIYTGTYDLGCIQLGNYYIRLFNANNNAWNNGTNAAGDSVSSYVKVEVDGIQVINDNGSSASTTGFDIPFSISSVGVACNPLIEPDTDRDGVIDRVDLDDDNDGIADVDEGLGINTFDCTIPALNFIGNWDPVLEINIAESGTAGQVGAIYRFENAIFGEPYDVLVEITEIRNAVLIDMDDDTPGPDSTPDYLQTRVEFTGNETPADCVGCDYPGITFQFTIVDTGTSTPAASLFRIGGTTWDVDGGSERRESVRYYTPSAYGTDNPTTLQVTDVNGDNSVIEMTAGGILEGPGFSTLPQLRSYFQFLSNTFSLRMQNVRTTFVDPQTREYGMSFTQCNVLDFKSASIIIVNGQNDDGDAYDNQVDLDADDDGIPDNVEAQPTIGYIPPSGVYDPLTGVDINYNAGLTYIDTDGDEIFDFLDPDSDNDGKLDIVENGILPDSFVALADIDKDGLNDAFETNGNEASTAPFDVNEDIENPSDLSILSDTDGDLALGGDLDYRDAIDVFFESASVDFDGIDDHLTIPGFVTGFSEVTLMAWVKIDPSNIGTTNTILGEDVSCRIIYTASNSIQFSVRTDTSPTIAVSESYLYNYDEWHHLTGTFSGITGEQSLYIDGELVNSSSTGFLGTLEPTAFSNGNFEIGRHARDTGDQEYFTGAVDEVRVFNKALTEDQVQQIAFQEIEDNGGQLRGTLIGKNIEDKATSATVPWGNLQAYYPMSNILTGKTIDASTYTRDALLKNIFTVQDQSAPMPYETASDGPWTTEGTWLHGDVWDIEDVTSVKDWSIVQIKNDVTTTESHTQLGMFIDTGKKLTVTGDNEINNTWYLELNGTIDLAEDSQLVQTENSDLVTSGSGKILRRQEGNSDMYWYNYWSSPVGTTSATALSDNNGPGNNVNNTPFSINMLDDGTGTDIVFTSAYDEVGKVSDKWLFSYLNGVTYFDWTTLTPLSAIQPGVGYTQKGTGNAGTEQQYIFDGKPNNGTIHIAATASTETLVGNPYPSALDTDKFIMDNIGIINSTAPTIQGTILLWEQWAGSSHNLAEYEGGYGYINLTETARAYQHPLIPIAGQAMPFGIKTPTKFLPVGQGFFVEVIANGNIEFNNTQRVYKDENSGESVFFRGAPSQNNATEDETVEDPMQTIKLEFGVSNGATRRFVLGFSEHTTDGLDHGYDGGLITQTPNEDMTSLLDSKPYVIQAFSPITPDKVIDLNINVSGDHTYSLDIAELKNINASQDIYLKDNQEGVYWDLRQGAYSFSANAGEDNERFDIVFKDDQTLNNDQFDTTDVVIYNNRIEHTLYVKGLGQNAKALTLTNMLGQVVKNFTDMSVNELENGLFIGDLSSGVYLVNLTTENNIKLNKKIILE